jgi:hypothetical protein
MTHFVEDTVNDKVYGPFQTEKAAADYASAYCRYFRVNAMNVIVDTFDELPVAYVLDTETAAVRGPQSLVESAQLITSSNGRLVAIRVEQI